MASYPISDGPHNDGWKSLLNDCFAVMDEVVKEHAVSFPVQIGGGSMLLRRYGHRKSKDLDLFVTDTRLVRWCSPRFNAVAQDLFADYGEEAASVKLITGMQEIDIIAANPILLEDATEDAILQGRQVLVERPREIIAKKVVYRGRLFQPRDVFDLACVAEAEPDEIAAVSPWISLTHVADLEARLQELEPSLYEELARKVEPYPAFEPLMGVCHGIATGIAAAWKANLKPAVDVPPHPPGYRVQYSRDGRTAVIKEIDALGRTGKVGNPAGPAMVSVDIGPRWFIGGVELTEDEWRRHPEVSG